MRLSLPLVPAAPVHPTPSPHRLPVALLAIVALAPAALAQPFPQNRLEWSNWWITDREDHFPNFAAGNVQGDGLFKIVPGWLLERDNDQQISGYQLGISVDDAFTGTFPQVVNLPGVQLYRTRFVAGTETLDVTRPVGPEFDSIPLPLNFDDAWVVEVRFDSRATNPKLKQLLALPTRENGQRAGLAILALAEPGQQRAPSIPGVVMQSSYQERHLPPAAQTSYSGTVNAANGQITGWGQIGQPSASGELYASVRFANPTLQIFGDASGGLVGDPQGYETHLGVGAYATDLASRRNPGFFGFFVQATQFDPAGGTPTHFAFPFLVSISAGGPTASLPLAGNVAMRVNPNELANADLLIASGLSGALSLYGAQGNVGYDVNQRGAWVSARGTLAPNVALQGLTLWVQALIVDGALNVTDTTNVVRWTLQ